MSKLATIHASMDATMQAFQGVSETQKHLRHHYGKANWLRDFRTMGFYVPRQNGATSWMLQQILKEPDSVLFSKFREHIILNFDGNGVCDVMKPKASMLSAEVQARMREPYDLSQLIKRKELWTAPLKLLVIDQSGTVFNNIRINKFYDWLEQSPGVTSETLILRIN